MESEFVDLSTAKHLAGGVIGDQGAPHVPLRYTAPKSESSRRLSNKLQQRTRLAAREARDAATIAHRAIVLGEQRKLQAEGFKLEQICEALRVSKSTLWRWSRRREPWTWRCGRKSLVKKYRPSPTLLREVLNLRAAGRTNAEAWRIAAESAHCPALLASLLRTCAAVPSCFLKLTVVNKRGVTSATGLDSDPKGELNQTESGKDDSTRTS